MKKINESQLIDRLIIRQISPTDSIPDLTKLLHRAYGKLKQKGMNFAAASQSDEYTRHRIDTAHATFLGVLDDKIISTISMYKNKSDDGKLWFHNNHVVKIGQFAVEPEYQKCGIGSYMMDYVENKAFDMEGVEEVALDTSERVFDLLKYYGNRGYREVGRVQWDMVNYESIVLSKRKE